MPNGRFKLVLVWLTDRHLQLLIMMLQLCLQHTLWVQFLLVIKIQIVDAKAATTDIERTLTVFHFAVNDNLSVGYGVSTL